MGCSFSVVSRPREDFASRGWPRTNNWEPITLYALEPRFLGLEAGLECVLRVVRRAIRAWCECG
jgi:hypothetical protein